MRIGGLGVLLCGLALAAGPAASEDLKAYHVEIGAAAVDLNAGDSAEVAFPDGRKMTVKLSLNPFVTYSGNSFSFVHPSNMSVAKSDLGGGTTQHLCGSARGTVIIIQEYSRLDPAALVPLLLQELTKESARAGAVITQQPAKRKVAGGKTLTGITAKAQTPADTVDYEIVAYGQADHGIMAITVLDEDNRTTEGPILAKFWDSLALK